MKNMKIDANGAESRVGRETLSARQGQNVKLEDRK